ncbi:hypothetical protein [Ornithinimicrobium faecis]|uniref:hypothetical protein n=1 Tax=Ornithinimicrobium faecis TaxID=2934158 RepID=UPI002118D323|nr:hypothetical protein [Ornithinimicrobium sp. HY1745]
MHNLRTTTARALSRRTLAVTGAGLILAVTGCSEQSPEETAEPPASTVGGSQAPQTGAPDPLPSTGAANPSADEGASTETTEDVREEQDGEVTGEDAQGSAVAGPAPYAEGQDPCKNVASEDLAEAVGHPLGERTEEGSNNVAEQLEESGGDLANCWYPQKDGDDAGLSIAWLRLGVDFPDEMPEDIRAEHERSRHVSYATVEDDVQEVAVPGVPEAYSRVFDFYNSTQVSVSVPFDDALLVATLVGDQGSLDESDIPRVVRAAEVAFAQP